LRTYGHATGGWLPHAARETIARVKLFANEPADAVTAVSVPSNLDVSKFLARLVERFGLKLTGGQDELKGKIFRIAHMGYMDELDIIGTISAMELVLAELGWNVELGRAVQPRSKLLHRGESCGVRNRRCSRYLG